MKKHLLMVLISMTGLWGCNPSAKPETTQVKNQSPQARAQRLKNLNIHIEDAIQIDSSQYVMFPLTMKENEEEDSKDYYKEMEHSNYWNIAFYHTKTHTYQLLDEKQKILIYEVDLDLHDEEEKPISDARHIFYRVTTTDSNHDKRFNANDLKYLFASDRTGRNFHQISPSGYDLISYKRLKAGSKVVMLVWKDSNRNRKYEFEDEKIAFIIDLNNKSAAKEIFTGQSQQKLKELFDRDWQRVK